LFLISFFFICFNKVVARDPMVARSEFLKGIGVPPAKGS